MTHFRKGNLWRTWCGLIPDQCEADLDDVTCWQCRHERNVLGRDADILERAECVIFGHLGHQLCGFCEEHREPRAVCQCAGPLLVKGHD